MNNKMPLIVNADDFGYNESRTNAIHDAWKAGVVTHSTVMVNMPDVERAVSMAKRSGFDIFLGLHLTLTEGLPLTENIRHCRTFCDEDGSFNRGFLRCAIKRFFLSSVERRVLAEEIEAQFKRFLDLGLRAEHFDSHHHVHFNYSIAREAIPIARKYGFRTVRMGYDLFVPSRLVRVYRQLMNYYYRKRLGLRSEHFAGYNPIIDLSEVVGTTEIMVHPHYLQDGQETAYGELFDTDTPFPVLVLWLSRGKDGLK